MVGAEIVHFQTKDLDKPWVGGEVVLSASTGDGWDSAGVFSPGAAFNAVNGTWALYFSGISSASSGVWLGLASSSSPSGGFVRAFGGDAVIIGWDARGARGNGSGTSAYEYQNGAIPAGGDLGTHNTTVAGAELHCSADPMCKGFTFEGPDRNPPGGAKMYFKRMDTVTADTTWQSYTKKEGPPTLSNATQLRHARPIWRGGKTGSAKSGLVAVTAIDLFSGDATLNLFGLAKCHDRTCDHAVYEWSDNRCVGRCNRPHSHPCTLPWPYGCERGIFVSCGSCCSCCCCCSYCCSCFRGSTSLKAFGNNPILGGGSRAAYGIPAALPTGAGGVGDVEMFYGPDGLLHAIGCPAANTSDLNSRSASDVEFEQCHHYVNGGPSEVGATTGVQWYGPVGLPATKTEKFAKLSWMRGATPVVIGVDAGGYPGQQNLADVPTHFLHARGGNIYSLQVSWEQPAVRRVLGHWGLYCSRAFE